MTVAKDFAGTTDTSTPVRWTGEEGQDDLAGRGRELRRASTRSNRAQIVMHYYVRKVLLNRPAADGAPWQPYIDVVRAA